MRARRALLTVSSVFAALVAAACGGSPTSPDAAPFRFTATPFVLGDFTSILPMGYQAEVRIRPWVEFDGSRGHMPEEMRKACAPGAGTVTSVTSTLRDGVRVEFATTGRYRFYLIGLESATVAAGQTVAAGGQVGWRRRDNRGVFGVGLGLINPQVPVPFANPARYPDDIRYAGNPLSLYDEPLRSNLRARVTPPDADLAVSYDVPGRLLGLWYLPTVPLSASLADDYREDRLSFFYTYWDLAHSGKLRVHWGGSGSGTEQGWPVGPDPRQVSVSSGMVRYDVPLGEGPFPSMILLVQMTGENALRFEAFNGYYTPNPSGFTDKARTYIR